MYGGEVVRAYFHSTCGGHTEAAAGAFPGEKAGYLSGVPCFGELVPLGAGQERQTLDWAGRLEFLVRHLVGGRKITTPLEFAQALGQEHGRTVEEALRLPDFRPLLGPRCDGLRTLWHFRMLRDEAFGRDPWSLVLQLARLSGAVEVLDGVVVAGEQGPRWREKAGGSERTLQGVAVLWYGDGQWWVGAGEALAGSPARLWCTASGCPVVEVEASAAADSRSAFRGWIRDWKAADLAARLGVTHVLHLAVTQRTATGRVSAVEVGGSWGRKTVSGLELRRLLDLPSTWFVVASWDQGGELRFRFFGKGWGHGVGLCQNGAYGLSLGGWNYQRILEHYYPGTQVVHWPAASQEGGL